MRVQAAQCTKKRFQACGGRRRPQRDASPAAGDAAAVAAPSTPRPRPQGVRSEEIACNVLFTSREGVPRRKNRPRTSGSGSHPYGTVKAPHTLRLLVISLRFAPTYVSAHHTNQTFNLGLRTAVRMGSFRERGADACTVRSNRRLNGKMHPNAGHQHGDTWALVLRRRAPAAPALAVLAGSGRAARCACRQPTRCSGVCRWARARGAALPSPQQRSATFFFTLLLLLQLRCTHTQRDSRSTLPAPLTRPNAPACATTRPLGDSNYALTYVSEETYDVTTTNATKSFDRACFKLSRAAACTVGSSPCCTSVAQAVKSIAVTVGELLGRLSAIKLGL